MARSANIAPRKPKPSPAAPRVVEASCTTTAPTPTMARPAAIHATAKAMLPVGSMPSAASPAPDSTLAATTAMVPSVTAAASADQRPTTPAPSSSRRPSSSSVRVCRRTTTNPSTAVRKAPIITVLNTASASAVWDGDRAVEGDDRRVGQHAGQPGGGRLVGGVERERGLRRPDGEDDQAEHAARDEDAVAPPGQAQQVREPGEPGAERDRRGDGAPSGRWRWSCRLLLRRARRRERAAPGIRLASW